MSRRVGGVGSALVFILASFPAFAGATPSGAPIVIGAIVSAAGAFAPLGEVERNALRLAEKEINERGGVDGHPLSFDIQDDEGKPETAAQLATQMIGKGEIAIIGGSLTATTAAVARVTAQNKVLQIFMTPTAQLWDTPHGPSKYLFEATPRNELETPVLVGFAKRKLGAKKVAILWDSNPYGTQGSKLLADECKKEGLDVVASESYPATATDVTAQLLKFKSAGSDTVFMWGASQTPALAVRQMRQLGMKVNILGSTGILSDNNLRIMGKDGEGVYSDSDLNFTLPNAQQRQFIETYHNVLKVRPTNFASFAWDAAHLVVLALKGAHGKTDGDLLASALEHMGPYTGSTGTYKYTASDHNGLQTRDVHLAIDKNQIWFTL